LGFAAAAAASVMGSAAVAAGSAAVSLMSTSGDSSETSATVLGVVAGRDVGVVRVTPADDTSTGLLSCF